MLGQREAPAHQGHDRADHDRQMQAGDGQDMRQAGLAECDHVRRSDAGLVAQQHADRDLAGCARNRGGDAVGHRLSQSLHRIQGAPGDGLRHKFDLAQRVAGTAEAGEKGVPLLVPASGMGGRADGADHRAHPDGIAGGQGHGVMRTQPHADGARQTLVRFVQMDAVQGDAAAIRQDFDRDHPAGQPGGGGGQQRGLDRRRVPGGELGDREAEGKAANGCDREPRPDPTAAEPGQDKGGGGDGGTQPGRRFDAEAEIGQHPGGQQHRQPQRKAAPLAVQFGQQPGPGRCQGIPCPPHGRRLPGDASPSGERPGPGPRPGFGGCPYRRGRRFFSSPCGGGREEGLHATSVRVNPLPPAPPARGGGEDSPSLRRVNAACLYPGASSGGNSTP